MRYRFSASLIRRVAIVTPYIVQSTRGSDIVIETPGDGWRLQQKGPRGSILTVEPPRHSSEDSIEIKGGDVWHGNIMQLNHDGEIVFIIPPVRIYNPTGHPLEIGLP